MSFLPDVELRPLTLQDSQGLRPLGLALGKGSQGLEVAVAEADTRPTGTALKTAWRSRVGGRATPVLMIALYDGKAFICGPTGDNPPAFLDQDERYVERICRIALSEPDRHAALRFIHSALDTIDARMPGFRNEGLLASHAVEQWLRGRQDSAQKARRAMEARGTQLLRALGYEVQPLAGPVSVLLAGPRKVAVAALLERTESPDVVNARFSGVSPASYALSKAGDEGLDWVVVSTGELLRLYSVRPGIGVGRRGRTETFVELHLGLLPDQQAALLWDVFSADALTPAGLLEVLLSESSRYGSNLGTRLRERIYRHAIPALALALARAQKLNAPTQQQLVDTFQMSLTVLFRLLFVAYAEDRDLLPYKTNDLYRARSLKEKAKELATLGERDVPFDISHSHWEETWRLFRAVDKGSSEWGVPAYNGGLFSEQVDVSPTGAALAKLSLSNREFGPVLRSVLVDESEEEGYVPVDFRTLGVRDFGTIYEGLLESELSVAETHLDIDERGSYVPTEIPEPEVKKGEIYLHNKSGARKATGSYFTKAFAVEHLLNYSLEPALDGHLSRLNAISDEDAGEAFFDFRVADIAMGSGHFLVAAVDRVERRFTDYLAKRPLPKVQEELVRLRNAAVKAMGTLADPAEIEDTQLLRRQIARRCMYGVDLNLMAVELARLSLWVYTFVPGLPLSLLDHHLVSGNSLVGIGTMDETRELLAEVTGPLFGRVAEDLMIQAAEAMSRVGRLADADAAEIERAREALQMAREMESPLEAMLDILAASRLDVEIKIDPSTLEQWRDNPASVADSPLHQRARQAFADIPPFHFPVAFPDVFQREHSGFDVIIGNPPWEKAIPKEDSFWSRYFPGFSGKSQPEREREMERLRGNRSDLAQQLERERAEYSLLREVLNTGPYPGMGTGDPDLYKAFCWRFWNLLARPDGRLGVVLPRSAWNAMGSQPFRTAVFAGGQATDLTFLLNSGGWVFDDAEHRYTISLTSLERALPSQMTTVAMRGPYRSRERFDSKRESVRFPVSEVLGWTDTAALPLLPTEESAEVFAQIRKAPRLDLNDGNSWRARPHTELHATIDKELMTFTDRPPEGYWPVFKGESFDIWENDHGVHSYYAWVDPAELLTMLHESRARAARNSRSVFSEMPKEWVRDMDTLPCLHPRIAFRNVTNRTNRRTVLAALLPPHVCVSHAAPYLLWPKGDELDCAFLLGVLSSIVLDWYARRFVEVNLTYNFFNPLPIPRPYRTDPLWSRAVALAGRLACPDERFREWAEAVGVEYGPLLGDQKQDMIHELDAVIAQSYGLSEHQLRHVFETFHEGWQYGPRMEATLKHYDTWKSKL